LQSAGFVRFDGISPHGWLSLSPQRYQRTGLNWNLLWKFCDWR